MVESEVEAASEIVEEGSVSFGRFAEVSLSWDRWSSFSPNKYLEEVEKCSNPGSVAKKKAYFEAHYRKIAAAQRDDELVEEEQKMETGLFKSEIPNHGFEEFPDSGFEQSELARDCKMTPDSSVESIDGCVKNMEEEASHHLVFNINAHVDEQNRETDPSFLINDETNDKSELDSKQEDDAVLVKKDKDGVPKSESQIKPLKQLSNKKPEGFRRIIQTVKPNLKKTPALKVEISSGGKPKKAPSAVTAKSPSKLVHAPSKAPGSWLIRAKKGNPSLPTSKKPLVMDDSKSAIPIPRSLHMSLSVEAGMEGTASTLSTTTTTTATTTRRTSIVEEMGDKEIVKRAFKTFKNSYLSKPSTDNQSSITVQVTAKTTNRNASPSPKIRGSDKEGNKKRVENTSGQSRQADERWHSLSSGPLKSTISSGNKTMTAKAGAPSSSFSSRNDERTEKQREFFNKLEKPNANEAEKTSFRARSKEVKEIEIRKLRQSLSFKAMPMPAFYRESKPSKVHKNKEAID